MPRYPEPKPRELKRIEEETKKETPLPYFQDAQTKLTRSILSPLRYGTEKDLNEFTCPPYDEEDPLRYVTTEYCENKAMGLGCKDLKTCPAYKKQKELQKKYPNIDWENIDNNKPEDLIRLKFIKKGVILNDGGEILNEENNSKS